MGYDSKIGIDFRIRTNVALIGIRIIFTKNRSKYEKGRFSSEYFFTPSTTLRQVLFFVCFFGLDFFMDKTRLFLFESEAFAVSQGDGQFLSQNTSVLIIGEDQLIETRVRHREPISN